MSYSVIIDNQFAGDLASIGGYNDLCQWIDTLSIEDHELVIHVREHGWTQNVKLLTQQLGKALRASPPADKTVLATARGWLKMLRDSSPTADSVLVISDGANGELPGTDNPKDDWSQY